MKQLANVVRTEARDGNAVLIVGDFNFNARDERELQLHQAQFEFGNDRKTPPVDVISATFEGDHPATFGVTNSQGRPNETFLTNKDSVASNECLDHVYFWRSERLVPSFAVDALDGDVDAIPSCSLEVLPMDRLIEKGGLGPTQVSDHCGWSIDMKLVWKPVCRDSIALWCEANRPRRKTSDGVWSCSTTASTHVPCVDPCQSSTTSDLLAEAIFPPHTICRKLRRFRRASQTTGLFAQTIAFVWWGVVLAQWCACV
jgi:hypothetical protein